MIKKYRNIIRLIVLLNVGCSGVMAQQYEYDFRSPLDIPLVLSANFGELRSGHFHSGVDFKTGGVTGKKLYAIEDGYVSRIKISALAYGNAIYVTHTNGYTSVYGHCDRFTGAIAKYLKQYQYKHETHTCDIYLKKTDLPVTRGELIGYSGNSGYSFGPHLHFEIRDEHQRPLNVLKFNYKVSDTTPPKVRRVAVYPMSDSTVINGKNDRLVLPVQLVNGTYAPNISSIKVSGPVALGVEAYDYLDAASNRCGVYSVSLSVNEKKVYSHELNRFSFAETRYINSHLDYEQLKKQRIKLQKSFLAPNNQLSIYGAVTDHGVFTVDSLAQVNYVIKDVAGNSRQVRFSLVAHNYDALPVDSLENFEMTMPYDIGNTFDNGEVRVSISPNSLYDDCAFTYKKHEKTADYLSAVYAIHNKFTPVHKRYALTIKCPEVADSLTDKLLIAGPDGKGGFDSYGGTYQNGFVSCRPREFGVFGIAIDTIAPAIVPRFVKDADLSSKFSINFKVKDNLSGIDSYDGYIDGKWALFEYDYKNDLLTYRFDTDRLERGKKHEVELFVVDERGNLASWHGAFVW